jgi:TatD DNase family protein
VVVDTHAHLDLPIFDADRDEVLARARAAGVTCIVPAVRPSTWDAVIAVGQPFALGVHPQVVPELSEDERVLACDADALAKAIDGRGCAVGECGLDGGTGERALQEEIFRAHLRAARTLGLPVIVHVLRAHDAAPRILREEGVLGGVMHSYSGGPELVPVYAGLGLACSFAGPITYGNARRPIEAAKLVPAELLLAETDAPDQAPDPYRGQRSEPAMVLAVIAGLARARGVSVEEMAALTTSNAQRVFGVLDPVP